MHDSLKNKNILLIDKLCNQIKMCVKQEEWSKAELNCNSLLQLDATHLIAHENLPLSLANQGKKKEAKIIYEKALAIYPNAGNIITNYSICLGDLGLFEESTTQAEKAATQNPNDLIYQINWMAACIKSRRYGTSIRIGEQIIKLPNTRPEIKNIILNNLANAYRITGKSREAIRAFRQAIDLAPELLDTHTNLLLTMHSEPTVSDMDILEAAKNYSLQVEKTTIHTTPLPFPKDQNPHKVLRIGFISPDFRKHPVLYFIEGLLAQLDRSKFHVECFSLSHQEDEATERIISYSNGFFLIAGWKNLDQVSFIRNRQIDIMIDLAGHTADSGLAILAHRCAPVQVTWLGFPGTSGLSTIDWRITDRVASPASDDIFYTERLIRLPKIFCVYRPLARCIPLRYTEAYQVKESPALRKGYITFGCCNSPAKFSEDILNIWSRILLDIPTSRLLIEATGISEDEPRNQLISRLIGCGIPESRIILIQRKYENQYLTYHDIDIALDTYPLTGGTTTFDTLWMGVPLVSLAGSGFRSRMSTSIISALGYPQWIAQNPDEYVQIAKNLSQNISHLNSTRLQLRQRMKNSPLMDELGFSRLFGRMLRDLWWHWLTDHEHTVNSELPTHERVTLYEHQFAQWRLSEPPDQSSIRVCLSVGKAITLEQAYEHLDVLLERARQSPDIPETWNALERWAWTVLAARPDDKRAVLALAHCAQARGHQGTAETHRMLADSFT
ncbi:MAG: tetratricopeptide repeat protein [Burkholderiaceae bacterium]|nr:tetratricopeptide repeat protein [Burkholderiaceae bacterium]